MNLLDTFKAKSEMMTDTKKRIGDGLWELQWLPAGDLNVDIYQRLLDQRRVEKIKKEWSDDYCTPLIVGCRDDGSLWVIDGQHHLQAALDLFGPDVELPCHIRSGMTAQMEAGVFLRVNSDRRVVSPGSRIKAGSYAGDAVSTAILEVLDKTGVDYLEEARGRKRAEDAPLSCWSSLVRIYKEGGRDGLFQTVMFLENAWEWAGQAMASYSVLGTWLFIKKYGDHKNFSIPATPFRIKDMGWEVVNTLSRKSQGMAKGFIGRDIAWCEGMRLAHNKGLPKSQQIDA